ncbi:MAG: AAA family ATPase [Bacteroidota bacterium]
MSVLIKDLSIKNFKSIKELDLKCKRINLLIGKPNAGKSNVLEALSMYCGGYEMNPDKFLSSFIRFDTLNDLFHYRDLDNAVEVISDIGFVTIRSYKGETDFVYALGADIEHFHTTQRNSDEPFVEYINRIRLHLLYGEHPLPSVLFLSPESKYDKQNGYILDNAFHVLKYHFKEIPKIEHESLPELLYDGSNLFSVIERSKELSDYAGHFFEEYGLEYVKIQSEKKMVIQRKIGRTVDQLGFELTPDTFQRLIYHVAAIKSNTNSVLLFEEPESHSFPPYIQEFANKVIESTDNQFFITTHSPYILNTFLQDESIANDLNIVLTWFENFQTKARVLSQKEIEQIYGNGIDIFFNMDSFIGND